MATQPPDPVGSDSQGDTAMGAGVLASDTDAAEANTGAGALTLGSNTSGGANSAFGYHSMYSNTTGSFNVAVGLNTLYDNISGSYNTVIGSDALSFNTGTSNAAGGTFALQFNTSGNYNSAFGMQSLNQNTTGSTNSAFGFDALYANYGGSTNSAFGSYSMFSNSSGSQNTAAGQNSLYSNTTGSGNAALGYGAMYHTTTGYSNLAFGYKALFSNQSGENNIALGNNAGYNVTGNYNIEIGNQGTLSDNHVIRIGAASTQTAAYIAGISTTHLTGAAVYVNSSGQLGVLASSERYKTAIASMRSAPEKLEQLRPVTFHLKNEPAGVLQYGLIAEEVDKVYPDLVIRDETGTVQGVRYDELAPLLLKEVQLQAADVRELKRQLNEEKALAGRREVQMQQQIAILRRQSDATQAMLAKLQGSSDRVAMR